MNKVLPPGGLPACCYLKIIVVSRIIMVATGFQVLTICWLLFQAHSLFVYNVSCASETRGVWLRSPRS